MITMDPQGYHSCHLEILTTTTTKPGAVSVTDSMDPCDPHDPSVFASTHSCCTTDEMCLMNSMGWTGSSWCTHTTWHWQCVIWLWWIPCLWLVIESCHDHIEWWAVIGLVWHASWLHMKFSHGFCLMNNHLNPAFMSCVRCTSTIQLSEVDLNLLHCSLTQVPHSTDTLGQLQCRCVMSVPKCEAQFTRVLTHCTPNWLSCIDIEATHAHLMAKRIAFLLLFFSAFLDQTG